jgi:hypothetical protein
MSYKANLDNTLVLSNEHETTLFWVGLTRKVKDSSTPLGVKLETRSVSFSKLEYSNMVKQNSKYGLKWWKTAGYDKAVILHDPTLVKDPNDLKLK